MTRLHTITYHLRDGSDLVEYVQAVSLSDADRQADEKLNEDDSGIFDVEGAIFQKVWVLGYSVKKV